MSNATSETEATADTQLTNKILTRVCSDLGMMLDCELPLGDIESSRMTTRPAAEGSIHISFKFMLRRSNGGDQRHGSVPVPLVDATTMTGFSAMEPESTIAENRGLEAPDENAKDGMMEISNLISRSIDGVLRETHEGAWKVASLGCQGVKSGVRPAFPYKEGDELDVSEMETHLGEFEPFKLILVLPVLPE